MTLLSLIKLVHLAGLIMGFGGAILADALILRGAIMSPIEKKTIIAVKNLSYVVFFGLALLWLSGAILVGIRASADPHVWMNQKIWAKVIIVSILTINGIAVHNIALGRLEGREAQKLFSSSRPYEMLGLSFIAAISSVSWIVPFVLGVATEFNFTVKAAVILSVYVALVSLGWATFFAIAYIFCEKQQSQLRSPVYLRGGIAPVMARPRTLQMQDFVANQFRLEVEFLKKKLQSHEDRWIEFQVDIQQSVANFEQSLNGLTVPPEPSRWREVQVQSSHVEHRFSGAVFQPNGSLRHHA